MCAARSSLQQEEEGEGGEGGGPPPPSGGPRPGRAKGGKRKLVLALPREVFQQAPPPALPPRDLDSKACVTIGDKNFEVKADELERIGELGRGAYGVVDKMRHVPSGVIMAVKLIRATVNTQEQKSLLMDLDISMRTVDCFYTVTFYGALFREGDVWICMELMDTSLDKFYKKVLEKERTIPEDILGKMAVCIVNALEHLHSNLRVIHRDVKPSNVLINRQGQVKMCDFGISGYLVDSVAKTMDAGCKPYMAPERINPETNQKGYNVKSDIWSLGITMLEESVQRATQLRRAHATSLLHVSRHQRHRRGGLRQGHPGRPLSSGPMGALLLAVIPSPSSRNCVHFQHFCLSCLSAVTCGGCRKS
ncbi:dual specificity mitogen-activated protein kinase kinase 6 isoform X2 [Vanacampus margaritifer]